MQFRQEISRDACACRQALSATEDICARPGIPKAGAGKVDVMRLRGLLVTIAALALSVLLPLTLSAQSTTQGAIRGTVLDPSGAAIPNAGITLQNNDTGQTLNATTNSTGGYNFAFLPPGHYTLTVTAPNYQKGTANLVASVGQVTSSNVTLQVSAANQTVTVSAEGGVLQTVSPSISTTMSEEQIQLVPNGGGDLTYIAQTAPGTVMNSQGGYGNFSAFGLPANTNNFTVNSMPENDPFLNLNNSGASNILLGRNDVSEATVVTNGYSGEYSMAGANVNYVSRSGTNSWHGNAIWWWNGDYVNANDYFNKQSSPAIPRPFVNDNQWAASIGGPIRKDKTFFFVNTEGLYVIVPVENSVNMPTPAFQAATLANIGAVQPGELSMYQSMFNLYNNAPGAGTATPITGAGLGCSPDFVGTMGFGVTTPCAQTFHNSMSTNTHEWLVTARVDQNFSNNDRAFVHFRMDRGLQATITDPLTPTFNVTSNQPQYEGQAQWVHTFSGNTVNTFNLNGSYYSAIFNFTNEAAALALQPVEVAFAGGTFSNIANNYQVPFAFPQGRNVTQYGAVDDFSKVWGNHSFKFGGNFARYDVTTHGPGLGTLPGATNETLTDFYNGVATTFQQSFPVRLTQPVNLYDLGMYAQDTWKVRSNLNLTFTMRADRFSNPSCVTNCFSRLAGNFMNVAAGSTLATPYNQSVMADQSLALPGSYHPWSLEPRFGFNYGIGNDLVISGGFGLFGTTLPAGYTDSLINNMPNAPSFVVPGVPYGPGITGNGQSIASAAATALRTGFASGANYATLNSVVTGLTGSPFSVPSFFNAANNIHSPRFQEWDLQIQKGFGANSSVSIKYVGNHGIWEQINNGGLNAYCGATAAVTAAPGTPGCLPTLAATGFTGATFPYLLGAPLDPRFQNVQEMSSGYNSNYNGLNASFTRRFSSFQFQLNYTWSHALDYVSNAGQNITPFNLRTNTSITAPQNPFNPFQNMYGNADYDIRHYVSANYVYTTPKNWFHGLFGRLLADWTVAGTVFWHTGLPFTVTDGALTGNLAGYGYGGSELAFADQTGGFGTGLMQCGSGYANPNNGACPVMTANFAPSTTGFGVQRRNQVYGPHFFDTDLHIEKAIPIPHWEKGQITIGAAAYNLFNHPNFDQPVQDVANPQFGSIILPANPPTSIYGSFLGADASPRLLQSEIKLVF